MSADVADAIFPRSFQHEYPIAVAGEGVYVYDKEGRRYLDCGEAGVMAIGYGVHEVVEKMCEQARKLCYVHSSQFHTPIAQELSEYMANKFPGPAQSARVHFTSGGSEATETAIKLARQYWLARGEPNRHRIVSRWHSYHGSTLGALGVSGNLRRRQAYGPLLPTSTHIAACFCYHCPFKMEFPACNLACATDLERAIVEAGGDAVAAFILEPIVGATCGAVPPEGYLRTIRQICDKYGILLIADEILTGVGRTGKYFAVEHWDVVPDLILVSKGISSGYAPLGAVLVAEKVWQTIGRGNVTIDHGFTFQAHPVSVAAGLAVQQYIEKHNLIEKARSTGEYLSRCLDRLRGHATVGDIRGRGLLQTIEFVGNRTTRAPFPTSVNFVGRLFEFLRSRGVLVYPVRGTIDGVDGEHILIVPPFVIREEEIDYLVGELDAGINSISHELG